MAEQHDDQKSRGQILRQLRTGQPPFSGTVSPESIQPVVPRTAAGRAALVERFVEEADRLACQVHRIGAEPDALAIIIDLLQGEKAYSCWEPKQIPLPSLTKALTEAGIRCTVSEDADVRVGLSGAQAALAATGSLVLTSGPGRYRTTSMLPPVHVAILRASQIVPDLESWLVSQSHDGFAALRRASNIIVVSGPSRTADIAMELVMGMHGPRELHIVLLQYE